MITKQIDEHKGWTVVLSHQNRTIDIWLHGAYSHSTAVCQTKHSFLCGNDEITFSGMLDARVRALNALSVSYWLGNRNAWEGMTCTAEIYTDWTRSGDKSKSRCKLRVSIQDVLEGITDRALNVAKLMSQIKIMTSTNGMRLSRETFIRCVSDKNNNHNQQTRRRLFNMYYITDKVEKQLKM